MREINAPVDINYIRGVSALPIIEVTIGKTDIEEVYPGLDILIKETRDYIFDYAEMSDEIGMPKAGDRITEDESGLECEVVSLGEDGHCFRWTTATRKRIRIHTQIVKQI